MTRSKNRIAQLEARIAELEKINESLTKEKEVICSFLEHTFIKCWTCSNRGRLRSQFKQGKLGQLGHWKLACDECYEGNNSGNEDDSDEENSDEDTAETIAAGKIFPLP